MTAPMICVPGIQKPWYLPWADMVSFRPPKAVQDYVHSRTPARSAFDPLTWFDWSTHRIETGRLGLNLDYYPVTVTALPKFYYPDTGYVTLTPEQFLEYMRTNINLFVDTNLSEFFPYDKRYSNASGYSVDENAWLSNSPVNTIISINIKRAWVTPIDFLDQADDGSVVCSDYASNHWRFSTIWTTKDKAHPVSGNREWGFMPGDTAGTYIYYTRGSDRKTHLIDAAPIIHQLGWFGADNLWLSLQKKICDFVNGNSGSATLGDTRCSSADQSTVYKNNRISERVWWNDVKDVLWHPTENWYYSDP